MHLDSPIYPPTNLLKLSITQLHSYHVSCLHYELHVVLFLLICPKITFFQERSHSCFQDFINSFLLTLSPHLPTNPQVSADIYSWEACVRQRALRGFCHWPSAQNSISRGRFQYILHWKLVLNFLPLFQSPPNLSTYLWTLSNCYGFVLW